MARLRDVVLWGEWRERLGRFEAWDSSAADFCQWEGVSRASFYAWRRKLGAAAGDRANTSGLRPDAERQPMFVQVVADAAAVADSDGVIVVRLANGHLVELPVGDHQLVLGVIQAVAALPLSGGDR